MFRKLKRYYYKLTHPVIGEVWQLHRVTNQHASTELQRMYEITPQRLESLIVNYLNKGYVFISMADVRRVMLKELKINQKFVSVTLDDGYRDNYEIAYPIFKKYNVPFCIYLLQNEVSGDVVGKYPMLTKEQILALDNEPLCTLGGHTYSHPALAKLKKDRQKEEILRCKGWMEDMLGHKIVDYSYPYGSYNKETIEILKNEGILQCPMAWGGDVCKRKHTSLEIPRKLVTETSVE